ncbi:MAG TPA: ATP-binding protein, partial [Puia sp.]|nr:ATP-binding protein [Puia sp.]
RIPENIPGISVSGEIRRNIFLTIKESLHNIVKHAKASRADIEFLVNSGLSATIRDNGKGFDSGDAKKETAGNGLRNMRKRMESIGGSFRIYNRYGVVIEIEVPLSI